MIKIVKYTLSRKIQSQEAIILHFTVTLIKIVVDVFTSYSSIDLYFSRETDILTYFNFVMKHSNILHCFKVQF